MTEWQSIGFYKQWNPILRFLWGPVDLKTELRKIWNASNLTMSLLTLDD
jgi:hypothetical protein